jgi:mRNA-degrading endonuclease RelE of RelBE toxin-antitoxin system
VIFVETSVFTRLLNGILSDDEYRELQFALIRQPEMGAVIQGSGGLRKIRWALPGRGKSGGVRVIYYLVRREKILMVYIYQKGKQDDLTSEQIRRLSRIVEEER